MTDEMEQVQYVRPREAGMRRRAVADGEVDGVFTDAFDTVDPMDDSPVDIFYLLDSLEELVSEGKRFPFSGKVMVGEDEFMGLIDQLRIAVPNEIKQAQRIIRERHLVIQEAHSEAVRITDAARKNAEYFVSEEGILAAARMKGEQILQAAEKNRNVAMGEVDAYALDQLEKVEQALRQGWAIIEESLADAQYEMQKAREQVGT